MEDIRAAIPDLSVFRTRRGISLPEIADMTKIRVFYLEAIEKGQFQKLPGGVYTRSYIRQYSQAIDFDADELLRELPPDGDTEAELRLVPESTLWGRLTRLVSFAFMPATGTRRAG